MDVETIDREYSQLEQEAGETGQAIQALAQKMQAALQAGDANAKEWLLDLKGITLQVQQEQLQMQSVLQALHGFAVNTMQAPAAQPASGQSAVSAPGPGGSGPLQNFLGGGFGRAIEMGAGFGIGNSLINSIFGNL